MTVVELLFLMYRILNCKLPLLEFSVDLIEQNVHCMLLNTNLMQKTDILESDGVAKRLLPDYAHELVKFFSSSLYMQDTIFTKNSRRNTEQWIELVVRFYVYDTTKKQKNTTYQQLKKLQSKVYEMMKCAFQFEGLLHQHKTEQKIIHEKEIVKQWSLLYDNMSKSILRKKKKHLLKSKNRKKKHSKKTSVDI